jgi:outer membrane protein assembly factor BamE (lipoprotein component of BamABCDE complex)
MREPLAGSLRNRTIKRQGSSNRGSEPAIPASKSLLIALQQAGARRGEPPHLFRNADVADADLSQHSLHIGAELIDELLSEGLCLSSVGLEAMEHGEQVKRQDDKAAFKRVRNPKGLIENGKPRLCHNRAIEFLGAEVFVAPRKQGSKRAQRTDSVGLALATVSVANKAASPGARLRTASSRFPFFACVEGHLKLRKLKPVSVRAMLPALVALSLGAGALAGCGAQIDRHGHVFIDVDLNQVQPGMNKDQVKTVLGSPDTTSTIGGDAYYYISTTQKTVAFFKPHEIDRQVVAVYFNPNQTVDQVAHYGLKDGIVINYYKSETPARGKDLGLLEQIFGNISNRKMFKGQQGGGMGIPGGP